MTGRIFEGADEFGASLPPQGAIVGLDPGTRTIGVAVSDATRSLATPLETIRRRKFAQDYAALADIIAHRAVVGVVVGLPLNMDGTEGPRAQSARAFAREIARRSGLPVTYWDERLSTAWAERRLIEQDLSRATRANVIDRVAASFILQGALDRMRAANR
jgi:putative Holliday junction resolvase